MKRTLLLLPLVLTVFAGGAAAQEVCTSQFSGCVERCVKDRSPAMQDKCIEVCQTNNTACYAKHNGLLQQQEEVVQSSDANEAQASETPMPRKKPAQRRSEKREPRR